MTWQLDVTKQLSYTSAIDILEFPMRLTFDQDHIGKIEQSKRVNYIRTIFSPCFCCRNQSDYALATF